MKSIREPVTEEMLLDFIDRYAWKRPIIDHELVNTIVNLKSNSALLYNKGHTLLKSAFPKKNSPKLNISLLKE